LWYWRQVLVAIVISFFQEVWGHKLLAGRALLIGWIAKYAWLWLMGRISIAACIHYNICDAMGDWHWYLYTPLLLASVLASVAACGISAWLVSRTTVWVANSKLGRFRPDFCCIQFSVTRI
jgi:hypothetical protein